MTLSYYTIWGRWDARHETPDDIARRFRRLVSAITLLHPAFCHWRWLHMDGSTEPFDTANADLATAIAVNFFKDDWGDRDPDSGYMASVLNTQLDPPMQISVGASASGISPIPGCNHVKLKTAYKRAPDPSLVAYEVFRPALLAMSESFDVDFCSAYPADLMDLWPDNQRFRLAWMSYVKPEWAPLITPPATAIVERRPNGGLFMAATDETFRTQNPAHLAVANDIVAALAPLEAMPDGWEEVRAWGRAQGKTA